MVPNPVRPISTDHFEIPTDRLTNSPTGSQSLRRPSIGSRTGAPIPQTLSLSHTGTTSHDVARIINQALGAGRAVCFERGAHGGGILTVPYERGVQHHTHQPRDAARVRVGPAGIRRHSFRHNRQIGIFEGILGILGVFMELLPFSGYMRNFVGIFQRLTCPPLGNWSA